MSCDDESPARNNSIILKQIQPIIVISDPKAECEDLMNALLPTAEKMLSQHDKFYPYGGIMSPDRKIEHYSVWTGDDYQSSRELIELLKDRFQTGAQNDEYMATAIVYNIRTIPPGKMIKQDAIAVALDHRANYSAVVIFPYFYTNNNNCLSKSLL